MDAVIDAFRAFRRGLPERPRIYVAGCAGEPLLLAEAIKTEPALASGVTFLGVWIPGVNTTDWAGCHPEARAETIFLSADLRTSFEAGRTAFLPLSYSQAAEWLHRTRIDGAIAVTAPAREGNLSLGIAADFTPIVLRRREVPALALATEAMPTARRGPAFEKQRFRKIVCENVPLRTVEDAAPPPALLEVGRKVASLIGEGDTLQFGLGRFQRAVLTALTNHCGLAIHSGMISEPVTELLDRGVLVSDRPAITTGVALGSSSLYARAAKDEAIRFRSVDYTHAAQTLTDIPRFRAINAAIEVDLFGQVNGEFLGGKQVSGTGGMIDFSRGAALSQDGLSITALTSTAKKGEVSRIVPRLSAPALSLARHETGMVVTEHGCADLRMRTIDERAEALIAIADPAHRPGLTDAWRELRSTL
jgi:acyl-CoA hydrolase